MAISETSSMVGKCLAITTARLLTSMGNLSSRASSISKLPAHSKALVLSSGKVIPFPLDTCCTEASLTVVAWPATSRRKDYARWPRICRLKHRLSKFFDQIKYSQETFLSQNPTGCRCRIAPCLNCHDLCTLNPAISRRHPMRYLQ